MFLHAALAVLFPTVLYPLQLPGTPASPSTPSMPRLPALPAPLCHPQGSLSHSPSCPRASAQSGRARLRCSKLLVAYTGKLTSFSGAPSIVPWQAGSAPRQPAPGTRAGVPFHLECWARWQGEGSMEIASVASAHFPLTVTRHVAVPALQR